MCCRTTELDSASAEVWEAYVANHSSGTIFHTLIWRDAVVETFGHRGRYLCAWRDGVLVGVFPLMQISSFLAGTILVSVPYAVYGGVLADDEETKSALLDEARRLAERVRAQWIDIRSIDSAWPELPVVKRYVTFRKNLPDDPSGVLSAMPRKARAAARQARERYGLQVSFDDEHLYTVWSLYSRSMRRLASPNYPLRFFSALLHRTGVMDSSAPIRHLVQVVKRGDEPIAGLVSFIYRGTLMPYFSGSDDAYNKCHPNNFLYLTAMERGVELGCREFDFGRSRLDNAGSYDFKRFQGFEPMPLNYQYYVPQGGREPSLHPNNPRLSLARRVWPKLPLAVTRPLGAWLAKSIPG